MKKFLVLVCAAVFALALTACGSAKTKVVTEIPLTDKISFGLDGLEMNAVAKDDLPADLVKAGLIGSYSYGKDGLWGLDVYREDNSNGDFTAESFAKDQFTLLNTLNGTSADKGVIKKTYESGDVTTDYYRYSFLYKDSDKNKVWLDVDDVFAIGTDIFVFDRWYVTEDVQVGNGPLHIYLPKVYTAVKDPTSVSANPSILAIYQAEDIDTLPEVRFYATPADDTITDYASYVEHKKQARPNITQSVIGQLDGQEYLFFSEAGDDGTFELVSKVVLHDGTFYEVSLSSRTDNQRNCFTGLAMGIHYEAK